MNSTEAETAVLDLENQRYAAMLSGDIARLRELMDPELGYIHSSGELDGLEDYLSGLQGGQMSYNNLIPSELKASQLGDGAVLVDGKLHLDAIVGGVPRKRDNRTTSVWVMRGESWRLIRFHAVPISTVSG